MIPQSNETKKDMTKEQEAIKELKSNGFTIVKDYSSR